jgi:excisionase family DNA binding protein
MIKEQIMEAKEVAEYLHLHLFTVHKFAREGRIPAFKIGSDWRFKRSSLDEWIDKEEKSKHKRR